MISRTSASFSASATVVRLFQSSGIGRNRKQSKVNERSVFSDTVKAQRAEEGSSASSDKEQKARDHIDLRVGKVLRASVHAEADKLYVEEIDLNESNGPRTICSGLVPFMKASEIEGKNVIVVANLKARNMQGVKSHGMILAASNDAHDYVELLVAPDDAVLGSRVMFGDVKFVGEPSSENQVQKKKRWEDFGPMLITNEKSEGTWKEDGSVMKVLLESGEYGSITCKSLTNATIG